MTNPPQPSFRLHALGTRDLRRSNGDRVSSVLAQPKRFCLLTYLAIQGRPVSRSTLAALFWPDSDETHARNALSQAVFYLRKSLTKRAVESLEGDQLLVPPARVWCDVRAFLDGDTSPELLAGARLDVLDGWNADDSQPLQEWLDTLRRDVRARGSALEAALAAEVPDAQSTGDAVPTDGPTESDAPTRAADPQAGASPGVGPTSPGTGPLRTSRRARTILSWLLVVGLVIVAVRVVWSPPVDGTPTVVALKPVVAGVGTRHGRFEEAVRLELLARLGAVSDFDLQESEAGSAQEARRMLEIVGEPWEQKWFLEVLATVDGDTVRVATVLTGGGRVHGDQARFELASAHESIEVDGPAGIAAAVARFVRARAADATGSRPGR